MKWGTTRDRIEAAAADVVGGRARVRVCGALAETFRETGKLAWVTGYLIGTDRRDGESPFGFGSDATVGLALVLQIAGELMAGAVSLLERDNLYAAAALLRQLVEAEYLSWAFSEDEEQATAWIRASREERLKMWQPRALRERSGGRFRSSDYGDHCERGGHPTPQATLLLPDHERRLIPEIWWLDLAEHGVRIWGHALNAAEHVGLGEPLRAAAEKHNLTVAIERWEASDPLRKLARDTPDL